MQRGIAVRRSALVTAMAGAIVLGGCISGKERDDLMHVDCLTAPDPGPCKGAIASYYYDYQSDSCRRFLYGGCQGRRPFASLDACVKACGARPGAPRQ